MQRELAHILKGKLITLPFADLVAGLADTLTTQTSNEENTITTTHRQPVSYDVTQIGDSAICIGTEVSLVPHSANKSILYFEDYGITPMGSEAAGNKFNSTLRLVAWLNRSKLVGDAYALIAGRAQKMVIERLAKKNPFNEDMFTKIKVDVLRIPPQDAALFGRYTYSEPDKQYLRPPYEFFGIDFSVKFTVPARCTEGIAWNIENCT